MDEFSQRLQEFWASPQYQKLKDIGAVVSDGFANHLWTRYKLTGEDYYNLLQSQQFACACCRGTQPFSVNGCFMVDHCHKTGQIRGLVCGKCNLTLGKLGDNIDAILQSVNRILNYLNAKTNFVLQKDGTVSFQTRQTGKAWLFQDTRQKKRYGEKAPWRIGWLDKFGNRKSRTIGSQEDAEKERQRLFPSAKQRATDG
jgi:hypothetical protein